MMDLIRNGDSLDLLLSKRNFHVMICSYLMPNLFMLFTVPSIT